MTLNVTTSDYLQQLVWIDLSAFGIFAICHIASWLELALSKVSGRTSKIVNNASIGRATQGGLSALGILLAATFAVIALRAADNPLPESTTVNVILASSWFLLALAFSVWITFRLAMFPDEHKEVIADVGVMFGLQLCATFIGLVRLVVAIVQLL